jgi:TPR repeat protein
MNIRTLIVAATLALASTGAFADDFQDGLLAMLKGDNETAVKMFRPLAENGNAEAQYHLGYLYETGTGVKRDDKEALRWFSAAAAQGHEGAAIRAKVVARANQ